MWIKLSWPGWRQAGTAISKARQELGRRGRSSQLALASGLMKLPALMRRQNPVEQPEEDLVEEPEEDQVEELEENLVEELLEEEPEEVPQVLQQIPT